MDIANDIRKRLQSRRDQLLRDGLPLSISESEWSSEYGQLTLADAKRLRLAVTPDSLLDKKIAADKANKGRRDWGPPL